jgi:CxxC motif-containing protein (DUF1111 family)
VALPKRRLKLRTAPFWGLRTESRFMHDLASLSVEQAIQRYGGESRVVTRRFRNLTDQEKEQFLVFLQLL